MAKGDKKRVQNAVDYRSQQALDSFRPLQDQLGGQTNQLWSRMQTAADTQGADYTDIMNRYRTMADSFNPKTNLDGTITPGGLQFSPITPDRISAGRLNYTTTPELAHTMEGYKNFADTGGYSDQDVSDIRARGVSPIRAVYQNAQSNIDRQRALQGGYSPNYNAATAKMAREQGSTLADATTNVNAQLAEAIRSGKLAGLQGLGSTSLADTGLQQDTGKFNISNALQAAIANQGTNLAAAGKNLDAGIDVGKFNIGAPADLLRGMTSLYGTTPAQTAMFGNQALNSTGQQLQGQNQMNDIMQMILSGQLGAASVPGNFQQTMGNMGSLFGNIGKIGGAIMGFPSFGGGTSLNQVGQVSRPY